MHVQVHAIYMIGTIFSFSFSIFLMKKDFFSQGLKEEIK